MASLELVSVPRAFAMAWFILYEYCGIEMLIGRVVIANHRSRSNSSNCTTSF